MLPQHENHNSGTYLNTQTLLHKGEEIEDIIGFKVDLFNNKLKELNTSEKKLFFLLSIDELRRSPRDLYSLCRDALQEVETYVVEEMRNNEARIEYLEHFLRDYRFEAHPQRDPSRESFKPVPVRKFYDEVKELLVKYRREPKIVKELPQGSTEKGWRDVARATYVIAKHDPSTKKKLEKKYDNLRDDHPLKSKGKKKGSSVTKAVRRMGIKKLKAKNRIGANENALPVEYKDMAGFKRLLFELIRGDI